MGHKLESKLFNSKQRGPGPGEYSISGFIPQGKYFSKYKNATSIIFGQSKEKRFDHRDKRKTPGPGNYKINSLFNDKGANFLSKFKNNLGKTMVGKFPVKVEALSPGPGSYRIFSEFGIYEKKNLKTEENFRKSTTNCNTYKSTTVRTTHY